MLNPCEVQILNHREITGPGAVAKFTEYWQLRWATLPTQTRRDIWAKPDSPMARQIGDETAARVECQAHVKSTSGARQIPVTMRNQPTQDRGALLFLAIAVQMILISIIIATILIVHW